MNDHALIKQALGHLREYAAALANEYGATTKITDSSDSHLEGRSVSSVILFAETDYLNAQLGVWSSMAGEISAFDRAHNDYLFHEAFEFQGIEEIISRLDRIVVLFRDLKPRDEVSL